MTGEFASDMSDAAGTMWLDVAKRDWSEEMLAACHLTREHMPALFEGSEVTGAAPAVARAGICRRAGGGRRRRQRGGGGRCRHGGCGQAMLSLGTSGVYFAVSDGYRSNLKAPCTVSAMRCRDAGI
jgi:xylulokinase